MKTTFLFAAALAATAGAQAAPLPCQPQSLLDAATIRERVILVGELHGTNEMPAFVSGLACSLLQQGRQVVLALEVPADVQPALERYLASDGGAAARQPLYAGSFGKLNDGRGSVAMMAMLEQVRLLRQAGAPIGLAATDMNSSQFAMKPGEKWNPNARDRIMAKNIAALAGAQPDAVVLSLSGNLHATKRMGGMVGADYKPLGYLLSRQMPTHAIAFAHGAGAAWICMGVKDGKLQCGVDDVGALDDAGGAPGYDRVVKLGGLTASPPAAQDSALRSQGGAQ
ncbi:MAG: hypothetical protein K0R43_961 [Pseudoduganella sp.]|nr:hypothetical protein [Pseudoduganella sp.]